MVEIDLDEPVEQMLTRLRETHGDEQVDADLKQVVQQAIWESYNQQSQ